MQVTQKFKGWIDRGRRFVLSRVGFWDAVSYDVIATGNVSAGHKSSVHVRKWVAIVARQHYFESVKDYPIGSVRDLKAVLRNEPWRFPFQGVRCDRLRRLTDQSYRVTTWVFKSEILESLDHRPMLLIPESLCILKSGKGVLQAVTRLGKTVHVTETADGILSSLGRRDDFFQVLGLPSGATVGFVERANSEAFSGMLAGLWQILSRSPQTFFVGVPHNPLGSLPWKALVIISLVACLSYLTLVSAYIGTSSLWTDYQLRAHRADSAAALTLRNDIKERRDTFAEIETIFAGVQPAWLVWDLLLDIRELDVGIRMISGSPSQTVYHLTANRATDIMAALAVDPRVATVELVGGVRQVNDEQQFALQVEFDAAYQFSSKAPAETGDPASIESDSPDDLVIAPAREN